MMKRSCFLCCLLGMLPLVCVARGGLAVVDMQEVLVSLPQGQAIEQLVDKEFAHQQWTLVQQEAHLRANVKRLAQMKPGSAAYMRLSKTVRSQKRMVSLSSAGLQEDMLNMRNSFYNRLLLWLDQCVQGFAKARGYSILIDRGSAMYAGSDLDTTPAALKYCGRRPFSLSQ